MIEPLTVYVLPGNAASLLTTQALDAAGLLYIEVDLAADETAVALVQELGFTTIPVVTIGAASWAGHQPDKIHAVAAAQHPASYTVPIDPMDELQCDSCQ